MKKETLTQTKKMRAVYRDKVNICIKDGLCRYVNHLDIWVPYDLSEKNSIALPSTIHSLNTTKQNSDLK